MIRRLVSRGAAQHTDPHAEDSWIYNDTLHAL